MSTLLAVPLGESRLPNARPGWFTLRFHWQVRDGLGHPEYTFLEKPDETAAVATAQDMRRKTFGASIDLTEVHVKRPGEDFWRNAG